MLRDLKDHEFNLVAGGQSSPPPGPPGNPNTGGGIPIGGIGGGTISVGPIGGFPPTGIGGGISFPTGGSGSGSGSGSGGDNYPYSPDNTDKLRQQNDRDSGN